MRYRYSEQWQTPYGSYGSKALCYHGSLNDYMVHNWSKWAQEYGIDGYYIDNMVPQPCNNREHGCGYRLPDGRIQPTFQTFGTREYFLRSRAAFLEQRPASRMVLHMTNAMIVPWVGAADVAYEGEHHVIYPEMGKDFMDFWSLERMPISRRSGVSPSISCRNTRAAPGIRVPCTRQCRSTFPFTRTYSETRHNRPKRTHKTDSTISN